MNRPEMKFKSMFRLKRNRLAFLACLSAATTCSSANAGGPVPDLPIVPASTVTRDVPAPKQPSDRAERSSRSATASNASNNAHAGLNVSSDSAITVEPGVTQIAAISRGHLNRLVTPFPSPEVMTSSLSPGSGDACGEICIKDNVVYVTTDSTEPVTLSLNESGRQDAAIMMTLVPKDVPPRELTLELKNSAMGGLQFGSKKAESWEESQPYVDTLTQLFRQIALNEVPQGYTLHQAMSGALPVCRQPGLTFDFRNGQRMLGHHFDVAIGIATNTSNGPIEVRETACGSQQVAAVASWPKTVLHPGDKTEIYVAVSRSMGGGKPTTQRPSLVR